VTVHLDLKQHKMKKESYLVLLSFLLFAFGLIMMMDEDSSFGWFVFLSISFVMSILSLINWHNKNR